jgi:hypothetical protein
VIEKANDLIFSGNVTNIQLGFLLLKSLGYSEFYCKSALRLFIENKLNSFDWQEVPNRSSKDTEFVISILGMEIKINSKYHCDRHYKGGLIDVSLLVDLPNRNMFFTKVGAKETIWSWDGYCKCRIPNNRQKISIIADAAIHFFFKENPFCFD